jgi:hypothetical protein
VCIAASKNLSLIKYATCDPHPIENRRAIRARSAIDLLQVDRPAHPGSNKLKVIATNTKTKRIIVEYFQQA